MSLPLKDLRNIAGLTRQELADRAGIHVRYLCGIELGRLNHLQKGISESTARAIAAALSLEVRDIEWALPITDNPQGRRPGSKTLNPSNSQLVSICTTCYTQLPATGICDNCT